MRHQWILPPWVSPLPGFLTSSNNAATDVGIKLKEVINKSLPWLCVARW
jgi:hypothetical protein